MTTPSRPHDDDAPGARAGITARAAWYTVAVLTLANVSGFLDRQILALLVTPMKRDLGITDTQVSLLMGLSFVLFYSVLGLPIGRWVDRGSRRTIVAIGAAVWSLFTMASGAVRTFGGLFASRIGVGVGEATLGPAAISLVANSFPQRRLGTAMGVYTAGTFLGSGIAYVLGAFVVSRLDRPGTLATLPLVGTVLPWQQVFFLIGLPGLLVALLAMTIREPRREGAVAGVPQPPIPVSETVAHVRRNARTIAALAFGFAFSASVNYGVGAWMATFFVRTHGWTVLQAGALQGIATGTVGVLGSLLGGRLTDHWAKQGHVDAPLRVGMVGALGMLVCAGLYPVVPSATLAAALIVPVNVFAALPWGAAGAAIAEAMPPRMRGQGSALYQLIVNLVSGIIGPTAVALLTDRVFGDENALRWSLAICTVTGMAITLALLQWGRPAFRRTVEALRTA